MKTLTNYLALALTVAPAVLLSWAGRPDALDAWVELRDATQRSWSK